MGQKLACDMRRTSGSPSSSSLGPRQSGNGRGGFGRDTSEANGESGFFGTEGNGTSGVITFRQRFRRVSALLEKTEFEMHFSTMSDEPNVVWRWTEDT